MPCDFKPLNFSEFDAKQMCTNARDYCESMSRRRTVRDFSDRPIPEGIIADAVCAAGSAPSGANMQPWHFVVIQDSETKSKIRSAAEAEEREFYEHRASEEWLNALSPLGTDANKPFLEVAPTLIAVFLKKFTFDENGEKHKNYYTAESVGIATGLLISALHLSGLATLTHTPSPMKFLNEILDRPKDERPYLLLVCGYPADDAKVPDIDRLPLEEISTWK